MWKVYAHRGSDQPAVFVCAWMDSQGVPLPLSHRLLDMVREQDRNTRGHYKTEDELNAELRARNDRVISDRMDAVTEEWLSREKSHAVLPRSVSLRMSRDKRRARGEKI